MLVVMRGVCSDEPVGQAILVPTLRLHRGGAVPLLGWQRVAPPAICAEMVPPRGARGYWPGGDLTIASIVARKVEANSFMP